MRDGYGVLSKAGIIIVLEVFIKIYLYVSLWIDGNGGLVSV